MTGCGLKREDAQGMYHMSSVKLVLHHGRLSSDCLKKGILESDLSLSSSSATWPGTLGKVIGLTELLVISFVK